VLPLGPGRCGQRGLEQISHNAPGKAALELAGPGVEGRHAGRLGLFAGGGQQRGLTDPGRSLEHQEAAVAGRSRPYLRADLRELGLAFKQPCYVVALRRIPSRR
jgi:hypothetical protein